MKLDHDSKYLSEFGNLAGWRCNQRPRQIAIFAAPKKPLLMWYIFLSLLGALISGVLYQASIVLF